MKAQLKKLGSAVHCFLLASCCLMALPASALTCSSGWVSLLGSYYNNYNGSDPHAASSVTGVATGTRADTNINFNWVAAGPGVAGVGTNKWAVRWDGTFRALVTGNYQFQTISDDGVRLYVAGNLVITDWNGHAATTNTSANVALVAGQLYTLKLEYYDDANDASMVLKWKQPGDTEFALIPAAVASPETASTCTCSNALMGGAVGDYFNNNNLTGSAANSRLDTLLDYNWGSGSPGVTGIGTDNFSVRWNGTFRVSTSGDYLFQTTVDDGVRLYVNNLVTPVISSWIANDSVTYTSAAIPLVANTDYPIRLEYYDGTVSAIIKLQWKLSGGSYASMGSCPAPAISYYGISHSTAGATCAAEPITITGYDATGMPVAPPSGTVITLSTASGAGTWFGGNTYTFNGTETFGIKYLQQTSAATLNINVTDGSYSEHASKDPAITFTDSTLTFYGSSGLTAMPNLVSGTTDAAPILKASCSSRVTGTLTVGMAYECRNPTTCVAGQSFKLAAQGVTPNANGATILYSTGKTLTFDGSGVAPLSLNYNDVGRVRLHAQVVLAASGNDPAITLTGTSSEFVVKPHTLVTSAVTTTAGVANPVGTDDPAKRFVAAGTPFKVFVEARNSGGNKTPNFGNETATENNIKFVAQTLSYPSGGTLTAVTGATSFTRTATPSTGEFLASTVVWDQVGSFIGQAELADNDYLGAGDLVSKTSSAIIGRFYPDYFALVAGSTTSNSCGTFSYLSHPAIGINYTLQAKSLNNTVLTNYGGNYAYTAPGPATRATPTYVAENADSGNGATFASRVSGGTAPNWVNGVATLASTTASVARVPTTYDLEAPYTSLQLGLDIVDSFDGRSLTGKDMNATTTGPCGGGCTAAALGASPLVMRYGRLRLDSASGPETDALPVNLATEYWTGTSFILNTADSCTLVPPSAITYTRVSPVAGGGVTVDTSSSINVAPLIPSTGVYAAHFTVGKGGHYFTAPGVGGVGTFTESIDLTTMPWLLYDWNQNSNFADDIVKASISFGTYRGNDRIIYWRELLQ